MNTILQFYPMDRYIPQLRVFLSAIPDHIVERFLSDFGPGRWKLVSRDIRPARYHPGYCATLYCEVCAINDDGKRENRRFYIKLYRKGESKNAYQRLTQVHSQHDSAVDGFSLLKPYSWCPQTDAIIFKEVAGISLEDLLRRPAEIPKTMEKIAAALHCLHSGSIRFPVARGLVSRNLRAISFISWACPELGYKLNEIGNLIGKSDAPPYLTPAHCDLKAEHIFLNRNGVSFIDIDSMAMADPIYDPAMLILRLNMLESLKGYSSEALNTATHSLLQFYFSQVPVDWNRRLPANLATATLKVALFLVQHQVPNWRQNTARLIDDSYRMLTTDSRIIPGRNLLK